MEESEQSNSKQSLIQRLLQLAEVDVSLSRLIAERKQFEDQCIVAKENWQKKAQELSERKSIAKALKLKADKEDKFQRDERDKLIQRRKALSTLGDYKSQQAGIREIDAVVKQLERRDEEVLNLMIEAEDSEKQLSQLEEAAQAAEKEYKELEAASEERLKNLEERIAEKTAQRDEAMKGFEPPVLLKYEGAFKRFPDMPLGGVDSKSKSCGGCFMSIPPQLFLKIARAETLEICPGCRRILYLKPDEDL